MSVELTFLTRAGCHLCADARAVVDRVVSGTDARVTEVDIDVHPDLLAKYDWDVPVVLVDGRQHSFHRVDPERLARALERAREAHS